MKQISLLFGHFVLRFKEVIEEFQYFMSVLSYLVVLSEVQKIILGDCSYIFVTYSFKSSFIDINHIFFNTSVQIQLNKISEKSHSKKILFIVSFN